MTCWIMSWKAWKKKVSYSFGAISGNSFQLSYNDALLFIFDGRNAELLIGKHVITAPFLKVIPWKLFRQDICW